MRSTARPEYLRALERDRLRFDIVHLVEVGLPVVRARNRLATRALEAAAEGDYIAWIDDDAWWSLGALDRMIATLDERPNIDILSGYCGGRDHFSPPFAFADWKGHIVDAGRSVPRGSIAAMVWGSFHFVVMRRSSLQRVGAQPFALVASDAGEDYSFFVRAANVGLDAFVDTAARIAHIGANGDAYLVGHPRGRIVNGEVALPRTFEVPSGPRSVERRAYGLPEMERYLAESDIEARGCAAVQSRRMPRPVRDTRAAAEWIAQRESNCARLADRVGDAQKRLEAR